MSDGRSRIASAVQSRLRHLVSVARFRQFLVVGAIGALCDNAVLAALFEVGGLPLLPAKIVSAETSIVLMFLINEHWTFAEWGEAGASPLARRFLRSNLTRTGGLAVGTGVLLVLSGQFGVWYLLANVLGIGTGFVVNYLFESLFTWQIHKG